MFNVKIILSILLFLNQTCSAVRSILAIPPTDFYEEIASVLKKYESKRTIQILEIGENSVHYTFPIAKNFNAVCTAMVIQNAHIVASQIKARNYKNITLLNPSSITFKEIYTLGRCEHFDIVIVHDIKATLKKELLDTMDSVLKLGEYVFIEAENRKIADKCTSPGLKEICTVGPRILMMSYKPKTYLDIARFTQWRRKSNPEPKYHIVSNFKEKLFYKESIEKATVWVPGINLITFIMLRGIYPYDSIIKRQLAEMKHAIPYHNDLVLGNIILQGEKLVPIDFDDKRRDANMDKCLRSAMNVFNNDKSRLRNPEKRIQSYYKTI